MGVEEERLEKALEILRQNCSKREEITSVMPAYAIEMINSVPVKITVGGATVFILDVERFYKM